MAARTLMIQGTASNVGKSLLVAALCRIFWQDGFRVAPFKSQNMSNNSYVTPDGLEIGRAQGVQAEAAGVAATADMNPVLLKPTSAGTSQVVIHGRPYGNLDFRTYRQEGYEVAARAIQESLARLRDEYEIVVIEGAGSPAEVNLRDRELVNMRIAEWADAPVLLVGDIDRGGVLASLVGTLVLLQPQEQERVAGLIINKFRGSLELLQPALRFLEERIGKPVVGVVPYLEEGIEAEDSLALAEPAASATAEPAAPAAGPAGGQPGSGTPNPGARLRVVAVRLPWISNFTDLDPLQREPGLDLLWTRDPAALAGADAVVLPGSKNTAADLEFLHRTGLAAAIRQAAARGTPVVGICGGYQMLGRRVLDPAGQESQRPETPGLDLLDVETHFAPMAEKVTVRSRGLIEHEQGPFAGLRGQAVTGYEIHMGRTTLGPRAVPLLVPLQQGPPAGAADAGGQIWGVYFHDIFHNDHLRRAWVDWLWYRRGLRPPAAVTESAQARRARSLDQLAAGVRAALDMERIYEIMGLRPKGGR